MKHGIRLRLAKSFRKGQAIFPAELQQYPGHVLNVIQRLAYSLPLSMATLNSRASSQIATFLQRLNFYRQNISCHRGNILAENGYNFNFDYYHADALGLPSGSRSILGEKAHLKYVYEVGLDMPDETNEYPGSPKSPLQACFKNVVRDLNQKYL